MVLKSNHCYQSD